MVRIRSASLPDLDDVVDLWAHFGGPTRTPGRRAEAERLLARDPEALIVATDDGIVGTLVVGWDGWRCHLYRLAVVPDRRRHGVARALVDEAQRRAAALGAARLDAMVRRENAGAVAFWNAHGFVPQDDDARWSLPVVG